MAGNFAAKEQPPVNYASQGAIAFKYALIDPSKAIWLVVSAGVPVNNVDGAGWCGPGSLAIDASDMALYQNTGTQAAPVWTAFDGAGGFQVVEASALHVDNGTKTAVAVAGAATLNKMSGAITSEALTTAAGSDYTLTLANSDIAVGDLVIATLDNGTNTQGKIALGAVHVTAGQVTIAAHNLHATQALNGTLVIGFLVLKA